MRSLVVIVLCVALYCPNIIYHGHHSPFTVLLVLCYGTPWFTEQLPLFWVPLLFDDFPLSPRGSAALEGTSRGYDPCVSRSRLTRHDPTSRGEKSCVNVEVPVFAFLRGSSTKSSYRNAR
ncbi:hypothetical protein DFS33DRAFT_466312 [Desarmillaria ectypa]|nr:hypothetical protein DFS33DRAFT_466312 [Desarmillaria ectypa]